MLHILGLISPLFGLIIIGFVTAQIKRQPLEALGWLNTFIIYVALPALFFKLLSKTPIDQLASWDFVATTILVTYFIFILTFVLGIIGTRGNIAEATVQDYPAHTATSDIWARRLPFSHWAKRQPSRLP